MEHPDPVPHSLDAKGQRLRLLYTQGSYGDIWVLGFDPSSTCVALEMRFRSARPCHGRLTVAVREHPAHPHTWTRFDLGTPEFSRLGDGSVSALTYLAVPVWTATYHDAGERGELFGRVEGLLADPSRLYAMAGLLPGQPPPLSPLA